MDSHLSKNMLTAQKSLIDCHSHLSGYSMRTEAAPADCDYTIDEGFCWPATDNNSNVTMACPDKLGYDLSLKIIKECLAGEWQPVNYTECSAGISEAGIRSLEQFDGVIRFVEFAALSISFLVLVLAILVFLKIPRLRDGRGLMHVHLMIAILVTETVRLVIFIDGVIEAKSIHQTPIVCEGFYAFLEYALTVPLCWHALECWNTRRELKHGTPVPRIVFPFILAWGVPWLPMAGWMSTMSQVYHPLPLCLGRYEKRPEFWLMILPRLGIILVAIILAIDCIRLMIKKRNTIDNDLKHEVRRAAILVLLVGVPYIIHSVSLRPNGSNLAIYKVYTLVAAVTYMCQGIFVCVLYFFTDDYVAAELRTRCPGLFAMFKKDESRPQKDDILGMTELGALME